VSENVSLLDLIEDAIASGEVALPARNQTAQQLQAILGRADYEIQEVLDIIESDQALTAEVLRVANSPFYGGLSKITTVRNAVVRVGAPEVVRLAIAATERESYRVRDAGLARLMEPLWDHALGSALAARWLARKLGFVDLESEAFIGGLLHDVGKLLLVRVCDDLLAQGRITQSIPDTVVAEILHAAHGRHGAALLQHWGLPDSYLSVVRDHHEETFDPRETLLVLVRLANHACHGLGVGLQHDASLDLNATEEAHALGASEILLAELVIMLEDHFALV